MIALKKNIKIGESVFHISENRDVITISVNFETGITSMVIYDLNFIKYEVPAFKNNSLFIDSVGETIYLRPNKNEIAGFSLNIKLNYTVTIQSPFKFSHSNKNRFIFTEDSPLLEIVTKPFKKRLVINNDILWEIFDFGKVLIYDFDLVILLEDPNPLSVERNRNKFSLLDFKTGEILWSFNLDNHLSRLISEYPFDHLLQLQEPLGRYKDQLWFSVTNYGLLCINHHTGAFMHYFRDCPENDLGTFYLPYGHFPVIPFTENAVLIENDGKIICFDSMFYWELNLENLELVFHNLQEYFQEVDCYTFGSRLKELEVDGNKIYMVSIRTKKIACFNRTTLQYDWIENLPEESGAPKTIEKHSNRLYVETTKKELLIYELDKND